MTTTSFTRRACVTTMKWPAGLILIPCLTAALFAESKDSVPDFSSLSLQELSIKITSVSRKQQKLSQAAAAVYVISKEEIRRSGMTSVADVLRLVPGLSVARIDANKWAVASRGFNGRFANKLLVFINGNSIYNPIFAGVCWDLGLPGLEDIERIEVIRGPGAAVWGANAVSGVVNIITQSATETTGNEVSMGAGNTDRAFASARHGGKLSKNVWYRVYANTSDHGSLQTEEGQPANDGWSSEQAGFRVDGSTRRGAWQLQGDLFHSSRDLASSLPSPANGFSTATRYAQQPARESDVFLEWHRQVGETAEIRINASYLYGNEPDVGFSKAAADVGDFQLQYRFSPLSHHDVSVGLADRAIAVDVQGAGAFRFHPSQMSYQTVSGFAQDEVHLFGDRLLLTAGLTIEHDVLSKWQFQPTARLLWAPNPKHSAWISVSRAVRTPTFVEQTAQLELGASPPSPQSFGLPVEIVIFGSNAFKPEVLNDYEIGYRAQVSSRLSFDVTGFYDDYEQMRSMSPLSMRLVTGPVPYISVPFLITNYYRADAMGSELALSYSPFEHWKVAASYGYLNMAVSARPDALLGSLAGVSNSSPAHQWKLQSYWNVSRTVQLDCHLFYAGAFSASAFLPPDRIIPRHLRTDLRIGWRVSPHLELSLVGQDILSRRHLEITPEAFTPLTDAVRGAYLKTTWRF